MAVPSQDQLIAAVFNTTFADCNVSLIGGATEPRYLAATIKRSAQLLYTADFSSSALHEAAHWCLAGRQRRLLDDFGYYYVPAELRNADDQLCFEAAEVRTQAVEWLFSIAAGVQFHLSVDSIGRDTRDFREAVLIEVQARLRNGLPSRAVRFRDVLAVAFGGTNDPTWARLVCEAERV